MLDLKSAVIGIIGLGYVGLPLAVEFGKRRKVIAFDISKQRLEELKSGLDQTKETSREDLNSATQLSFTSDESRLKHCDIFIITVPTPVNEQKEPDLSSLKSASETVGRSLSAGNLVIYESTVYPGATEEICVPILEERSSLTYNKDFWCGYSPERINPGDKQHTLQNIVKVTSGSNPEAARVVDDLYSEIITAGTFLAKSIKVAEAAKVIENTQRDLNIALMNELSIIFEKIGIDTKSVLEAAGTKWNFLPFSPGLVGGHCIGVDPYYLTHKSLELNYVPEIILAGRRLNDSMGSYVANKMIEKLCEIENQAQQRRILILGLTFKENCPDVRNSKVLDIVRSFPSSQFVVEAYDPWVSSADGLDLGSAKLVSAPDKGVYDGVILAVAHDYFIKMGSEETRSFGKINSIFFDIKAAFPESDSSFRL